MKQRTRYLVALGLGFVTWRIAIEVIPDKDPSELVTTVSGMDTFMSLVVAVVAGLSAWALTRPRHKDDQAGTLSKR
mgnify:CR=1 FL=1